MAVRRAERVARQVVQALASILEEGTHDARLSRVTLTDARMSDDLRHARVYFSCFGGQEEAAEAAHALTAASGYLRRELGTRLALRSIPALVFEYDESLARAERIEKLLKGGGGAGQGE
ncbi:MAG TPA: 30S ribosome-binding factor RbfA [Candidatus Limnocylindrales bacterium]|nr:30S ribosome-binding factor RbfA [Candidatus Limnocylindrales bacterium]